MHSWRSARRPGAGASSSGTSVSVASSHARLLPIVGAVGRFGNNDVLANDAGYGYRAGFEEARDADVRELVRHQFLWARRG